MLLLVAMAIGVIPGMIANGKGRSFFLWWLYGALLFIVALPHALLLPSAGEVPGRSGPSDRVIRCAYCAEWIQAQARVCRYCNREVSAEPPQEEAARA